MKAGVCETCGAGFKSSAYWFQMKKTDFPVKCSPCRLANRDRMRQALEGGNEVSQDQHDSRTKSKPQRQGDFKSLTSDMDANFPPLGQ